MGTLLECDNLIPIEVPVEHHQNFPSIVITSCEDEQVTEVSCEPVGVSNSTTAIDSGEALTVRHVMLTDLTSEPGRTLMTLHTAVNEVIIPALIDTGAGHSIITREAMHRAGGELTSDVVHKIFGIAEEDGLSSIGKTTLELSVSTIPMRIHQFIVVETNALVRPLVLGADFLRENKIEIDVAKCILH